MIRKKIYTAGKMSGLTVEEAMGWRREIGEIVIKESNYLGLKNPKFIHPPLYYNYENSYHKSEREIFDWEISNVINSDIVILNLEGVKESIGTHMELGAIASANRLGKNIKVIAIGKFPDDLHPWIECSWFRQEDNIEDAGIYIANYLLI